MRMVEQIKTKMETSESSEREMQKRMISSESEFEKQKALLNQKISFLEDSLKASQAKEKQLASELQKQKEELLNSMRAGSSKHEEHLKSLQDRSDDLQEQLLEKEGMVQKLSLEL